MQAVHLVASERHVNNFLEIQKSRILRKGKIGKIGKMIKMLKFSGFFRPTQKMGPDGPKWGQEDFFLLIQTLPTFLAERILILRIFIFLIFWAPNLGPAWAQAWAQAWARAWARGKKPWRKTREDATKPRKGSARRELND